MRTIALLALMTGLALAAKPVFDVPEAGGFDRAMVTLGVTNDGDQPLKVEKGFCDGLTVATKDGKELKMSQCDDLGAFTLGAGETVSHRFNLVKCFPDLGTPGSYVVTWKHTVFGTAEPRKQEIEIVAEYAEIQYVDFGTVYCRFYGDKVPKTVENFKGLALKGYYDNVPVHRIIPRFMMQGGDKERGDGTGEPGFTIKDEPSPIAHAPGILSMAKGGPDTGSTQFFICYVATPWLDGKHTTFGKVMEGMDVVFQIERDVKLIPKPQTDPKFGKPLVAPVMKKVVWHEKKKTD
ncbi:MAG: peptidylprolyl isomerase [Planctomycetota bacterium]